jgi:hypothetical protein
MKILTANRLTDGAAVWLASDHSWAEDIHDAEIAHDEICEEKLERAGKAAFLKNEVVDVAMIDIELADSGIRPTRLRERIRAAGPSIRRDLGKQAVPAVAHAA